MRKPVIIAIIAFLSLISLTVSAQRRVTPVNNQATATQHINENKANGDSIDRSRLIEMTDTHGNVVLVDTITGKEFIDTTATQASSIPKMIYPLFHSVTVSADIFQPAMRAFGQTYGLIGFEGELNLHNRYIPVFEFGLGQAKNAPDDGNYTYRTSVSPYFKIGVNYNFLYNSNPDYMVVAGIRYGFSPFRFSVTGITQDSGYWDEAVEYDIPSQTVTASYLELLFGLRVRIFDRFSLGWSIRYHQMLSGGKTPHGDTWYIPGYGTKSGAIGATFTLSYTLPIDRFNKKEQSAPSETDLPTDLPEFPPENQTLTETSEQ